MARRYCTVEDCSHPVHGHGLCGTHYARWTKHGDPLHRPPTPEQRFWTFVDTSAGLFGCWPWLGARHEFGYGGFSVGSGRHNGAHRFALEMALGRPLAPGMQARHVVCDNPPCVNPAHLAEGTQEDNMADRTAKGRAARGDRNGRHSHPERTARGERAGGARLTEADVRAIRDQASAGVSQRRIAAAFGVDRRTVQFVIARRTWQHVE